MQYNSIDHFLTVQHEALVTIMEAAQREAGGHYACYTPAELHRNAANDVREIFASIREVKMDNPAIRASAEHNVAIGVDLDDLIRMERAFEQSFLHSMEQELGDQPTLLDELSRRMRHLGARFRNNITGVVVDQTIQRLKQTPSENP